MARCAGQAAVEAPSSAAAIACLPDFAAIQKDEGATPAKKKGLPSQVQAKLVVAGSKICANAQNELAQADEPG